MLDDYLSIPSLPKIFHQNTYFTAKNPEQNFPEKTTVIFKLYFHAVNKQQKWKD